ncbi:DNA excision repair protein ERCC-5-like [Daphnia carinata]|uniref:DNA excision repair protein ERCC-5-like n=1 Tax=Daphnia carinata TaxID=120202 RepID=UPI00257E8C15|nr:DNA excision repair protein ERCC-5-like [Daphnia carinata]
MGVHGLWNLLEPVGKPVPLEALENKVLAVDVSIWLHQATKGFRDVQGNPLPNAHLLGLCHRLCKLLFFKIKPIFVFDGGVPALKRQTMASRQSRRDTAVKNNDEVAEKILTNFIKSEMINKQLGKTNRKSGAPLLKKKKQEPDLFQLPPLSKELVEEITEDSDFETYEDDVAGDLESVSFHMKGHNIHSVDVTSEAFRALPTEIQHEILLELRDTRKQSSWNKLHQMPQEADDFSGFQMERLLKRRNLQQRLDEVVKEIGQKTHEQFALPKGDVSESYKIASESATHYILIKKALEHDKKPKEILLGETGNSKVSEQSIPSCDRVAIEDVMEFDQYEFSQQELFAIMGSEKQEQAVTHSSSSDGDSDFEEVPPVIHSPINRLILDIPINPTLTYDEEDDMFADVFSHAISDKTENSTKSPKVEESILANETDILPVKEKSRVQTHEPLCASQSMGSKPVFELHEVGKECDHLEQRSTYILPEENNEKKNVEVFLEGRSSFSERCDISLPENSDTGIAIMGAQDANATFVGEDITSATAVGAFTENTTFVDEDITSASTVDTSAEGPFPHDSLINSVLVSTSIETCKINERNKKTGTGKLVDEIIEAHMINVTDRNSQMSGDTLPNTSNVGERLIISNKRKEELEKMDNLIQEEQSILIQQHGKQERLAASITDQMYCESQELLRLFGIPFLVAPMEAEAQCAFLDEAGLTQGTITDDSDIWLFGGRRVYKNFFNKGKYVEFFEAEDIHKVFKLGREKLVHLALLTGSDYTEGIQGVGPVCALEILAEFPSQGLEALEQFRDWINGIQAKKNAPPENKIRQKIRNLQVKPGFPNRAVVDAYKNPEVNESLGRFSWNEPDMDALRDFLNEKIGWNRDKFNSVVIPVLERFKDKQCQTRIDSYFSVKFPPKAATIVSKRVMNALRKADFGGVQEIVDNNTDTKKLPKSQEKRGKTQENRHAVRNHKRLAATTSCSEPTASASGNSRRTAEVIWQKETDKQKLVANKLKAIELFKKSKGRSKRPTLRPTSSPAYLSDSNSNSS